MAGVQPPSAVALTVLGLYASTTDVTDAGCVHGLKLAAVAIVAAALLSMAPTLTPDLPRLLLAVVAGAVALAWVTPHCQVAIIGIGALVGWLVLTPAPARATGAKPSPVSRRLGVVCLTAFVVRLIGLPLVGAVADNPFIAQIDAFYRAGALVFGTLPLWDRLRASEAIRRVLTGTNAAVVGLLAAALWTPVWTQRGAGARGCGHRRARLRGAGAGPRAAHHHGRRVRDPRRPRCRTGRLTPVGHRPACPAGPTRAQSGATVLAVPTCVTTIQDARRSPHAAGRLASHRARRHGYRWRCPVASSGSARRRSLRWWAGRCLPSSWPAIVVAGLVAVALMISIGATAAPFLPQRTALAECSRPNRWPSFAKVAPRADTVFVGTVTKIVSYWRRELVGTFAVKVDEALKGHIGTRVRLSDVYTTGGCVVSWLDVHRGDRIAVALGGESDVNGPVSAVAFLSPLPPLAHVYMAGMRRLTMSQVRQAVGLPATDSFGSGTEQQASTPPTPGIAAWETAVVAFVSLVLRGLRAAF